MAFKMRSGNKPVFKMMGSYPTIDEQIAAKEKYYSDQIAAKQQHYSDQIKAKNEYYNLQKREDISVCEPMIIKSEKLIRRDKRKANRKEIIGNIIEWIKKLKRLRS